MHQWSTCQYTVAVRALCDFTAKAGSLDIRFTPSPSAQQGIAGHAVIGARRGNGYQRELSLQSEYQGLCVRGRADGYDTAANRLEEIKTYRGELESMPDNHRRLHWAQVKIYGAMLCAQKRLAEVELALVYFDIVSTEETVLVESFSAVTLQDYFAAQCARFSTWAAAELQHRTRRDGFLKSVRFPHPALRQSQRDLAERVYKSAASGLSLMAQAPTGIGKTIGTLFPLLKVAPSQGLDKIFLLVAKTSARAGALKALRSIVAGDDGDIAPVRVLEFVSKASACEYPGRACNGDSCPLAEKFYDRLPAARAAAAGLEFLDQAALRSEAARHHVCPYYLGQEMAKWCDVIVGDYNYYFDSSASLYALTSANQWRVAVLVDEAHNLLTRARAMYSAELLPASFEAARAAAPASLASTFTALLRAWQHSHAAQEIAYQTYATISSTLRQALQSAVSAIADHFAEDPAPVDADLQQFYFEALYFARMAEDFGSHSLFDISIQRRHLHPGAVPGATLSIRNVIPGAFLAKRFSESVTNILFSATLGPAEYYRQLLGLPSSTGWIDVKTPFLPEQLEVRVSRGISTRYRDRGGSAASIVALIARQYTERPGNYLAFFSSFEYLNQVSMCFRDKHPLIPVREQTRGMDAAQRTGFLEQFTAESRGIAFAVLGGAFAEGIDLPGNRLIGAFIATLGLPQINPINAQLESRMQELFGTGYEYIYLYPGLQKVVQAAGRVIRTLQDRGTVHLMDDRFMRPEIRALLPQWWRVQ